MEAEAEEQALKAQELELTHRDKVIMEKLWQLIENLEDRQVSRLEIHTGEAEKQASEVKRIIIIFGTASLLLLLLAGTNIYLYIRRNNEYRAILAKARNDAEALARDRQQFLANMSHEIKTPMNVIAGYLSQVLENPLPKSSAL
jgi:signal transduction histidine kinase